MNWKTAVLDTAGAAVVIWSIPLAILVVGAPVVLLFLGARELARWLL